MKARNLNLTILAVFLTGIVLSVLIMNTKVDTDVDIVALNKLMKIAESNWEHLEQAEFSTIKLRFAILSNNGQLLYQNYDGSAATINEAIRNRSTIADIMVKDTLAGKVIVDNDYTRIIGQIKERLAIIIISAFTLLSLLCVLYVVFLNQTVFKPFEKLRGFAMNVARGNLDIPLTMGKNNPFGAFTESFDIMREELAAARQSEYEANRSKKELVASLSHDIKTPVASIKAVCELMLLRAADDKASRQLNMLYSKAEQINLLVTDMFHATLEELNELKVTIAEELSTVLNGMLANVNDDDQVSWQPIPECMILTDTTRLQQVLDNIVSNAYKYAGTSVTIASRLTNSYLELHIMDEGSGIDDGELPLVFNKFYRGSNAEGKSGSGLGLYISKYLMQKMQGDIVCLNRDGGFTVTLTIKLA